MHVPGQLLSLFRLMFFARQRDAQTVGPAEHASREALSVPHLLTER